jgi:hypothetical protein
MVRYGLLLGVLASFGLGAVGCMKGAARSSTPERDARPVAPEAPEVLTSEGTRAVQIAIAEGHACARMADGTVRCWGDNTEGEVGDGTTTERHIPVAVRGIHDAIDVIAGLSYSCARLASGRVRCWAGRRRPL